MYIYSCTALALSPKDLRSSTARGGKNFSQCLGSANLLGMGDTWQEGGGRGGEEGGGKGEEKGGEGRMLHINLLLNFRAPLLSAN